MLRTHQGLYSIKNKHNKLLKKAIFIDDTDNDYILYKIMRSDYIECERQIQHVKL